MAAEKKTSSNKSPAAERAMKALENEASVEEVGETTPEPEPRIPSTEEIMRDFTGEGKRPWSFPGEDQPMANDWHKRDYTYFPGGSLEVASHLAFDRHENINRPIGKPTEYEYKWEVADPKAIAIAKADGWRFCLYDGGSNSGLAPRGFAGTDLFEKTIDGRVLNGDVYLMFMDRRRFEAMEQQQREEREKLDRKPVNDFMNDAYKSGIRGFTENEWGDKTYPDPNEPPKLNFN